MISLADVGILTGIATSVTMGIAFIIKLAKKHDRSIANRFSGDWHSEGDITGPPRTHNVELLALSCKGKEISGIIQTKNLETGSNLPNGSLHGKRRGKSAVVKVVDISHGMLVEYGSLRLSLISHGIHLKTVSKRMSGLFPEELDLWK